MAAHCLDRCPECQKLNVVGRLRWGLGASGERRCNTAGGTTHRYV